MTGADWSWLDAFPANEAGFHRVSTPRRFAFDEETYDSSRARPDEALGRGVEALTEAYGAAREGATLEVGCGTGAVSVGLVKSAPGGVLLTDPSDAFLALTKKKLGSLGVDPSRVRFATLSSEDASRLPADTFRLVVVRSAMHHILDVDCFLADVARALLPGGIFLFQEPCLEGYVLMGSIAQFLPALAKAEGAPLSEEENSKLLRFVDMMRYWARRDVDKDGFEDKHLFRPDEIARVGETHGLGFDFIPNEGFESFGDGVVRPGPASFFTYFRDFVRLCAGFDPGLLSRLDRHLEPYFRLPEDLARDANGPYAFGTFVLRKGGLAGFPAALAPSTCGLRDRAYLERKAYGAESFDAKGDFLPLRWASAPANVRVVAREAGEYRLAMRVSMLSPPPDLEIARDGDVYPALVPVDRLTWDGMNADLAWSLPLRRGWSTLQLRPVKPDGTVSFAFSGNLDLARA